MKKKERKFICFALRIVLLLATASSSFANTIAPLYAEVNDARCAINIASDGTANAQISVGI